MKWCGIGFESNDGKKKEPEQQANLQMCTNTLREIYNNGPKELSAEKIAEFQNKAGCEELTKYMKIGKTAMEAYFADYQKYPVDIVPYDTAKEKLPPHVKIVLLNGSTQQFYKMKGVSDKCDKGLMSSTDTPYLNEVPK